MRFSTPSITTTPRRVELPADRNAVYIENKARSGSSRLYVQFGGSPGSATDALVLHPGDWRIFDKTQPGSNYGGDMWLWTDSSAEATVGVA